MRSSHDIHSVPSILTCGPLMVRVRPHCAVQMRCHAPNRKACFELFGFDVLLDSNMRPWLLEVNTCPALGTSTAVDKAVKKPMLQQLVHLVCPAESLQGKQGLSTAAAVPSHICATFLNRS